LLSSWGIEFEPVNVEANPNELEGLKARGIRSLPAVIWGGRAFHGWSPRGLASFFGVPYSEAGPLPPAELARRLDRILGAAQRAVRQVPDDRLGMKAPDRDRTVKDLAYHIFRLSMAYRDAMEQGMLREEWIKSGAPPEITDGPAIALYGREVRARLADWMMRPGVFEGNVNTCDGQQTAYELLERTTWHAAQHLRQLYFFLQKMGVDPENPLADEDYQGLPLPKEVWS